MFSSHIFDFIISLLFVYLVLSLITSSIVEYIQNLIGSRANFLERGIENMLGDPELKEKLYWHPLIRSLAVGPTHKKPSYIPSDVFASVIFDILLERALETSSDSRKKEYVTDREKFDALYEYIATLKQSLPQLSHLLQTILNESGRSIVKARVILEDYYNKMVDSLSGRYSRNAQLLML